jgi:hypothetical protein
MGNIMAVYGDGDCLDGPEGCKGETFPRLALSGSGDSYSRCDQHYDLYVERVQPQAVGFGETPLACRKRLCTR